MDLRERLRAARLYLVLDGSAPEGLLDAALRGGVDIVQLRDKELSDGDLVAGQVVAAGAPGIAVVRAIRDADDPEAAARML